MHYIEEIQQSEQEAERIVETARNEAEAALELARSDSARERATLETQLHANRSKALEAQVRDMHETHDRALAEARQDAEILAQAARTKLPEAVRTIQTLMFS